MSVSCWTQALLTEDAVGGIIWLNPSLPVPLREPVLVHISVSRSALPCGVPSLVAPLVCC